MRGDLKLDSKESFSVGLGLTQLSLILSPSVIDSAMGKIEEYISLIIMDHCRTNIQGTAEAAVWHRQFGRDRHRSV